MKPAEADISFWMRRVAQEFKKARPAASPTAIHHLRVVVRRVCSIVQGLLLMKQQEFVCRKINQLGKKLLKKLNALRDMQVEIKWATLLCKKEERLKKKLTRILKKKESREAKRVKKYLKKFDIDAWQALARDQIVQGKITGVDTVVAGRIVHRLARRVRDCDRAVLKVQRPVLYHHLRIAFKKYRYFSGHFLSQKEKKVEGVLKRIQTVLGNVQDLQGFQKTVRKLADKTADSRFFRLEKQVKTEKKKNRECYRRLVCDTQVLKKI
jgi:CHAD domain-containing protein